MIDGGETERRVRENRKEGDEKGADQHGVIGLEIDEQQRRDGDDRRHLQHDGERQQRALQPFRLRDQQSERDGRDGRDDQRFERDAERDEQRRKQQFAIFDELCEDRGRRGQNIGRNISSPDDRLPGGDHGGEDRKRQRDVAQNIPFAARAHAASSAIAARNAREARRLICEKFSLVRNSASRGSDGSMSISSTIFPRSFDITTMRVER